MTYWEEFTGLVLAKHPEWGPFVRGAVHGRPPYCSGDERFYLDIPSVHPTRREPLVTEVADRVPGGPIDTYWGEYHEHNFCWPRGDNHAQIACVIQRVEEWMSDDWVFRLAIHSPTGIRSSSGGYFASQGRPDLFRQADVRYAFFSWRGTHDRAWPEN